MPRSNLEAEFESELAAYREAGLSIEVLGELKSGKEASVYLIRADERLRALKFYRPVHGKSFVTDPTYREGRRLKPREARAFARKTRFGRELAQRTWIAHEFVMLRRTFARGVPVPEPISRQQVSILLDFVADTQGSERPAPRLIDVELSPEDARQTHATLMRAIIDMLSVNVVHADLSPFNILMPADGTGRRRPVIIDFPQAVDPRRNRSAFSLLQHDIEEVTRHLARVDPAISDRDLAPRLWARFLEGALP